MELVENDYWWKTLVLDGPGVSAALAAEVEVAQPQGFLQQVQAQAVERVGDKVHVRILYPLIDDGRYDPSHGIWNGAWEMGQYQFKVKLRSHGEVVAEDAMDLDPHTFFPFDRMYIAVDARPQFIECAPRQMLYMNEDEASFMIRIRNHRVTRCNVEIDVTGNENATRLAGPWHFALNDHFQQQNFSTNGWGTGEYWIRIRTLVDGQPVGPYCIRKFWKQVTSEQPPPAVVELCGYPEVMVDGYSFEEVTDIQFVPNTLDKTPDAPLVSPTEPHEEEMLRVASLNWSQEARRYECVYSNFGGRVEREDTAEQRKHLKMLLISDDGGNWEKPNLGLVEYEGSKDNNIVADDRNHPSPRDLEKVHDIEHAQFRFYDAEKDGPVNLDNVFVASGKQHFPFACKSLQRGKGGQDLARAEAGQAKELREDGLGVMPSEQGDLNDPHTFRPSGGEHWPFEKRGDEYLVLTRKPLFYLGVGMDLMHTTESIRCHVEDVGRKRLLYYFRPGAPAYPPHGATYDNMHLALRCLGVIWTDDGLNYHRQFVLGPDAHDRIGSQFYSMGMLQKFDTLGDAPGRPVLDKCLSKINQAFPRRNLYLGSTLLHWGLEQTQAPELIWTRDFLHFRRFRLHRRSMIENGVGGTYDHGMIRESYKYHEFDGQWWYHFTAVNTRHNGYGYMARWKSIEDLREKFPNHAEGPYFDTWEGDFIGGKQTKYLPAVARCKPYRLACAEPVDVHGRLVTRLLRVDGSMLRINAQTDPGGGIEVELEDESGRPLFDCPYHFEGDEVAETVADISAWVGQQIRIRFNLDRARLYAFEIVAD